MSDHADYKGLMGFIGSVKPKRVLTFHGGNFTKDFHTHVRRRLGIAASPLTSRIETISGPKMSNEARVNACSKQILRIMRIPGFLYQPSWVTKELTRQGYTPAEAESSIEYLKDRNILKVSKEGVSLT